MTRRPPLPDLARLVARLVALAAPALRLVPLVAPLVALLALLPPAAAAGDPKVVEGKWNKRDIPQGWLVTETDHYQVQCQAGKEKAQILAQHLESMWEVYSQFMPTRRKPETFVLKIFADRDGFVAYGENKKAIAYYSQSSKELVGYDTGMILGHRDCPAIVKVDEDVLAKLNETERQRVAELVEAISDAYVPDTARALSHEGWHQYFHMYTVSWVDMPSWLDEGVGDYFYMADRDESSDSGHGYRLGDLNANRIRALRRALVDGTTVDVRTLMSFTQEEYYKNPGVSYAQGWSLVQFLMHNADPKFHELVPRLIKDFKESKNFDKSTDKVFKGIDFKQLDRDWIGWVITQPYVDPARQLANEFGDRIKPEDLTGEPRVIDAYTWHVAHPGVFEDDKP